MQFPYFREEAPGIGEGDLGQFVVLADLSPYIVHPENCSSAVASRSAQPGSISAESTFAAILRVLRATGRVPSALSVMV